MGLALGLALLACLLGMGESPLLRLYCADGEYAYVGQLCCKYCPAGTYVGEPCTIPHTLGRCISCTEGVDYTKHPNGLNRCLPCDKCKPGIV
ncbi:tumor necrosis factor receptor superfamily member 23-like [Sceloporus undulatus]|uniref:tumor necrosis factor receptor superfamily member 23-like n=1 Tax=Sceloporus undulatus TaxID=8520 RepID=UPI001C4BD7D5|nr:tumor necrosis factor receptor superfamily member 23-like [Sceloporus undulatus]